MKMKNEDFYEFTYKFDAIEDRFDGIERVNGVHIARFLMPNGNAFYLDKDELINRMNRRREQGKHISEEMRALELIDKYDSINVYYNKAKSMLNNEQYESIG